MENVITLGKLISLVRNELMSSLALSLVPSLSSGAGAGRRAWYPSFTHASNFRHVTSQFNARYRISSRILRRMTESYGLDNGYDDITSVGSLSSPVSLPVRGREEEPGIHRLRMCQILGT